MTTEGATSKPLDDLVVVGVGQAALESAALLVERGAGGAVGGPRTGGRAPIPA